MFGLDWNYLIINYYYYYLLIIFIAFIVLLVYNWKFLVEPFKKIKKKTWLLLILIFLLGFSLRMWYVPHTFRVFEDEYLHLDIVNNMFLEQKTCHCKNPVNMIDCSKCSIPFWPPVAHFILSIATTLSEKIPFLFFVSVIFASCSIILVFSLFFLIFKNEKLALFSSLFLSCFPVHLKFSGTLALENYSFFFITLSFILFFSYVHQRKNTIFFAFFISLLLTIQIKLENVFIFLVFLFAYILLFYEKKNLNKLFVVFLVLFVLLIPHYQLIKHNSLSSRTSFGWMHSFNKFSTNLFFNICQNTTFFFKSYILFFSVLSLIGLFRLFHHDRTLFFVFVFFFACFFFIYSAHNFGSFQYGNADRYFLNFSISFMVFFVSGMDFLFKNIKSKLFSFLFVAIIIFILFLPWIYKIDIYKMQIFSEEFLFLSNMNISHDCVFFSNEHYRLRILRYDNVFYIDLKFNDSFYDKINNSCKIVYDSSIFYKDKNLYDFDYEQFDINSYRKLFQLNPIM
ncbi:MAG: glycosyltransferase family 39 protein [Nanoarchaeota archaeon]|nr:glycosyltransferase family 39 protein [Nanoarchaeota archaeon]